MAITISTRAQAYLDPGLGYNKLLKEKLGDGVYKLIGNFKVIGTSYLFGEKHKGDIFSSDEKAYNISLSYNTYNQELEFYSTSNPDKPLIKEPGSVDSFIIHEDISIGIVNSLKYVYGSLIGASDKCYYQEIYVGKRFSLYKRYKSDLAIVSSNYIQSELREFDLQYDYYYIETDKKGMKKLKRNASSIISEFKNVKDLSSVVNGDAFSANPEDVLRKAFDYLNN